MDQYFYALDYHLRLFQKQTVVSGNIRLTLRAVYYKVLHLAQRRLYLGIGGEGCAAHTHNAGTANRRDHFLCRQLLQRLGNRLQIRAHRILHIVFDNRVDNGRAVGSPSRLQRSYLARNAGMHVATQRLVILTDALTHRNHVTHLNYRLAGCAYMLLHGDGNEGRVRKKLCLHVGGIFIFV